MRGASAFDFLISCRNDEEKNVHEVTAAKTEGMYYHIPHLSPPAAPRPDALRRWHHRRPSQDPRQLDRRDDSTLRRRCLLVPSSRSPRCSRRWAWLPGFSRRCRWYRLSLRRRRLRRVGRRIHRRHHCCCCSGDGGCGGGGAAAAATVVFSVVLVEKGRAVLDYSEEAPQVQALVRPEHLFIVVKKAVVKRCFGCDTKTGSTTTATAPAAPEEETGTSPMLKFGERLACWARFNGWSGSATKNEHTLLCTRVSAAVAFHRHLRLGLFARSFHPPSSAPNRRMTALSCTQFRTKKG